MVDCEVDEDRWERTRGCWSVSFSKLDGSTKCGSDGARVLTSPRMSCYIASGFWAVLEVNVELVQVDDAEVRTP